MDNSGNRSSALHSTRIKRLRFRFGIFALLVGVMMLAISFVVDTLLVGPAIGTTVMGVLIVTGVWDWIMGR